MNVDDTRRIHVSLFGAALALCTALSAFASELPIAKPEKVGMSSERLKRIDEAMARHVQAGTIAGAVTAVARRGQVVHFQSHGLFNVETRQPMPKNSLFRMASSSKPITGVAVMMMVEEGRIRLSDPVSQYIPEFKNMKVAVPKAGQVEPSGPRPANSPPPEVDLVPAKREITIKDLLTHTSGLQSGGLGNQAHPVDRQPNDTLATFIPKLAAAPLDFQPGTQWRYSAGAGIDTLGRIIEIVSGMPLDQFLSRRIFEPLGMTDTYFNVPDAAKSRQVPLYRKSGAEWQVAPPMALLGSPIYFSGAAGLNSTAGDYLRFEQMLLNGGQLNGKRLLSPKTIELMSMNHVADLYHGMRGTDDGVGFGLTVYVTLDETRAPLWRSQGAFGWSGAFGTISWTDPEEELVAVLMIQQSNQLVQRDFHTAVMQAIME
jgi:CubicO group peptidase (beta-lactamase class C family)